MLIGESISKNVEDLVNGDIWHKCSYTYGIITGKISDLVSDNTWHKTIFIIDINFNIREYYGDR